MKEDTNRMYEEVKEEQLKEIISNSNVTIVLGIDEKGSAFLIFNGKSKSLLSKENKKNVNTMSFAITKHIYNMIESGGASDPMGISLVFINAFTELYCINKRFRDSTTQLFEKYKNLIKNKN